MRKLRKSNQPVLCSDGFSMSVQASSFTYCYPQVDQEEEITYISVEVGYPSEKEDLLIGFAEDRQCPTETVYPYVPVTTVALVCAKHGGVVSGELPRGVPWFTPEQCGNP